MNSKKINVVISFDDKHAISDFNVKQWYKSLKDGDTAHVGTHVQFGELRAGVYLGEIAPFTFELEGQSLTILDNGMLKEEWPENLFGHLIVQMDLIMSNLSPVRSNPNKQVNASEYPKTNVADEIFLVASHKGMSFDSNNDVINSLVDGIESNKVRLFKGRNSKAIEGHLASIQASLSSDNATTNKFIIRRLSEIDDKDIISLCEDLSLSSCDLHKKYHLTSASRADYPFLGLSRSAHQQDRNNNLTKDLYWSWVFTNLGMKINACLTES